MDRFLVIATRDGEVKKINLSDFGTRRCRLIDQEQGDQVVSAKVVTSTDAIALVTRWGKVLKLLVNTLPTASRRVGGVRGIRLAPGDCVIGMEVSTGTGDLVVITNDGNGKRIPFRQYRIYARGGIGQSTYMPRKPGFARRLVATASIEPETDSLLVPII